MEHEVSRPVSANTNISTRKTSLGGGKNGRSSDELSSSPTDPLRRAQRRTSTSSLTSSTNQQHRRSQNGVPEDSSRDGRRISGISTGMEEENQLSINPTYKIPILGYEVMEERAKFTVFKLRVENEQLNENWLVFRRYTDFERLYAKLKEEYPLLAISLPPKRWLRDNFESAFLEERLKGLQAFVDSILLRHKLAQSPTVREFFCFDDPPLACSEDNAEVHLSLEENKVASSLQAKQNEIDVLKTELLLMKTQYENLLRLTKNCGQCNIQQRNSLTSPPAHRSLNSKSNSALSSVNNSPKKHVENDSKPSTKSRNYSNASSTSSSTSTSYAEIPTKVATGISPIKSKRRSSAGKVEPLSLPVPLEGDIAESATIGTNQPNAPPRKPRKSMPSTTSSSSFMEQANISTNSAGKPTSMSKESASTSNKTSTLSPQISPLHDADTVDLTPQHDSSKFASDVIL